MTVTVPLPVSSCDLLFAPLGRLLISIDWKRLKLLSLARWATCACVMWRMKAMRCKGSQMWHYFMFLSWLIITFLECYLKGALVRVFSAPTSTSRYGIFRLSLTKWLAKQPQSNIKKITDTQTFLGSSWGLVPARKFEKCWGWAYLRTLFRLVTLV